MHIAEQNQGLAFGGRAHVHGLTLTSVGNSKQTGTDSSNLFQQFRF